MAYKEVQITDIGQVRLFKRKGSRSMRLTIAHDGKVRVTMPLWAPYRLGIEFARTKSEWIKSMTVQKRLIRHHDTIGKAHRIEFTPSTSSKPSSRLSGTVIKISLPVGMDANNQLAQATAEKACVRALKKETEQLLPSKVREFASEAGYRYGEVKVKRLKSRWGSCTDKGDLVFNCFLIQLPWHLIEYVIWHELAHTRVMSHGHPFWTEMGRYVDNLGDLRKEIKQYQPRLMPEPAPPTPPASPSRRIPVSSVLP